MSDEMHFLQLEKEFAALGRGEPRLTAIRSAIREADEKRNAGWQFMFRYDYIEESIFCGDRYYALIMFPELLKHYESTPELQGTGDYPHLMLIAFKWIVEAAPEFPQISRAEIDSYFREFKKQLRREGKSLSAYYMKRSLFYLHVDLDIASKCFYRFLDEPLDDSSDGIALYYDQQVMYYLWFGEIEKARKAAEPIFREQVRSSALPQSTHHFFLRYYMTHKNLEEAEHYARLAERRVNGNPYYHDCIGSMLSLYARLDLPHAIRLFNRNYPDYLESRNPWLRVYFAIGAAHMFAALQEQPEYYAAVRLPTQQTPAAVGEAITAAAKELAEKFDARNGTDDYMKMYLYPYGEE